MGIFILAILLGLAGLGTLFVAKQTLVKAGGASAFVIALLLGVASFITIVPPGHVGVKVLFGSVQPVTLDEGLHFVNPFMNVYQMSGRTQTYTMSGEEEVKGDDKGSIATLSKDGLRIPVDVSVIYRLDAKDAAWVLQNIGYDYESILLQPAARAAVREAISNYTAQEAYSTKRGELATSMRESLRNTLNGVMHERGFDSEAIHVQDVLLRNVDLPQKVKEAIEAKLEADQDQQRMTFILEKERKEAERKVIEAKGIQQFQDIVRQGIDEQLLRWKGIEATESLAKSSNTKIIIVGGGKNGLPVILNTEDTTNEK